MASCRNCGRALNLGENYCSNCGTPQPAPAATPPTTPPISPPAPGTDRTVVLALVVAIVVVGLVVVLAVMRQPMTPTPTATPTPAPVVITTPTPEPTPTPDSPQRGTITFGDDYGESLTIQGARRDFRPGDTVAFVVQVGESFKEIDVQMTVARMEDSLESRVNDFKIPIANPESSSIGGKRRTDLLVPDNAPGRYTLRAVQEGKTLAQGTFTILSPATPEPTPTPYLVPATPDPNDQKRQLEDRYNRMASAYGHLDADGILAYYASRWRYYDTNHTVDSLEESRRYFRKIFDTSNPKRIITAEMTNTIEEIVLQSDGTLRVRVRVRVLRTNANGEQKTIHVLQDDFWDTSTMLCTRTNVIEKSIK